MREKKNTAFYMKASQTDKSDIARLARRWRVSESDAVRLAVKQSLQSQAMPRTPARLRRVAIRRKAVE